MEKTGEKCRIVIIDSGVSNVHKKICGDRLSGVGIEHIQNGYIFSDDIDDWADHGTGIYGIIKGHNENAEIFIVKLSQNVDNIKGLIFALEYIYNNVVCNLINISISASYCNDRELIRTFEELCKRFLEKNIFIISAFDNFGGLSYPAVFDSVIGVSSGDECLETSDVEYVINNMVNVCGKGGMQSVISSMGCTIMREGNSLACAHITGIISQFYKTGMTKENILRELMLRALRVHDVECKNVKKTELPITDKKAAVITFGKEMHSVLRFSHLLQCKIVKVYDVKQTGMVGKSVNYELNACGMLQKQDYIIENIQKAEYESFDMVILGHISQLIKFKGIKNIIKNFLDRCVLLNKYIYSLDDLACYFHDYTRDKYFTPRVTRDDAIFAPLGKLHYISKPLVGVFGTSSMQGKFTLQLKLREILIKKGYLVGQIGSEPTALLFGMDYCFPFGYNSSVEIARYDTISYLNKCLYNICCRDVDIILLGCQSRTIQEDNCNLVNYPLQQIEFLLATQPDIVILCVNPWDTEEYVSRTINTIENLIGNEVIAIAMSPIKRILKEDNCYKYMFLSEEESKDIVKKMVQNTGKSMYNIADDTDMLALSDYLVARLSGILTT